MFFVPVAADTLEAAGSVVERMRHDVDVGLFERDDALAEVRVRAQNVPLSIRVIFSGRRAPSRAGF